MCERGCTTDRHPTGRGGGLCKRVSLHPDRLAPQSYFAAAVSSSFFVLGLGTPFPIRKLPSKSAPSNMWGKDVAGWEPAGAKDQRLSEQ